MARVPKIAVAAIAVRRAMERCDCALQVRVESIAVETCPRMGSRDCC